MNEEYMGYLDEIREKGQDLLAVIIPVVMINVITLVLIAIGANLSGMGEVIGMELSESWGDLLATCILVSAFVSGGLAIALRILSRRMRVFNFRSLKKGAFVGIWIAVTVVGAALAFWIKVLASVAGDIWKLWVLTFTSLPTILIICALNIAIFIVIFIWMAAAKRKAKGSDEEEVA